MTLLVILLLVLINIFTTMSINIPKAEGLTGNFNLGNFSKDISCLFINGQNLYVSKIRLNLFEISNRVLKFENLIQIWKYFILSENLFQIWIPWSGAMCVYSTLSHEKVEYTHNEPLLRVHVWNQFSNGIKKFQIWITFSNFKTWFGISNKFKWIFKR